MDILRALFQGELLELALAQLADLCPKMMLHHTHGQWCLHTDRDDPSSYQHEDIWVCIHSVFQEIKEMREQSSMN